MFKVSAALVFSLFLFSSSASELWRINRDHSEIFFKVQYLGQASVTGRFQRLTGNLTLNDSLGKIEKAKFEIDLNSIMTGNEMRDGHLKNKDFFNTKKYPKAYLTLQKEVSLQGEKIPLILELKGIKKEIEIKSKKIEEAQDTWGYQSLFMEFEGEINREDFDLTWNKTLDGREFLVSKKVKIFGQLQLQPAHKMTPSSQHKIPDTSVIRDRERFKRGEIEKSEIKQIEEAKIFIKPKKEILKKNLPAVATAPEDRTPEDKLYHWLNYIVAFSFGLAGAIYLSILIKKFLDIDNPKKNMLSDLIIVGLFIIFSSAFFYLTP